MLQGVAVNCNVLQFVADINTSRYVSSYVAVRCIMLKYVARCCSMLQRAATCFSVLQTSKRVGPGAAVLQCAAVSCSEFQ